MENERKILQEVLDHLNNSTQEQLEKDWESLKEFENIGPTADEYFNSLGIEKKCKNN